MLVDRSARAWAMHRDEMMIAEAVQHRESAAAGRSVMAGHGAEPLDGSDFASVIDGVAVIPVRGMLMRQMSFFFWSYEEILRDVELAQASSAVRSILLNIDSPGGMVAGLSDAAKAIRASGPKPIEAFAGGMCASAAYYIAAAADRIHLGSGAMVGSVGAVIEYVDMEPMLEAMGARIIRVVAEQSPNKRLDPESAEGRAEMQALVNASGAEFVADVASFRGISEADVLDRFGQGMVFDTNEAISRGMADTRSAMNDILAGLAARRNTGNAATATAATEVPMDWDSITKAALQEHRPDLVTDIEAGATAAVTATTQTAVTAERDRILALDDVAVAGHEDLVAAAKADGKTTASDLALQIIKAEKAAGGQMLASLREADVAAAVAPVTPEPETATHSTDPEEVAKAKWAKDGDLRAEFKGDEKAYLALARQEAAGRVKILRRAS